MPCLAHPPRRTAGWSTWRRSCSSWRTGAATEPWPCAPSCVVRPARAAACACCRQLPARAARQPAQAAGSMLLAADSLLPACCPPRTPCRRFEGTQPPPRTPAHPPINLTHPLALSPPTDDQQVDQLLSQDDGQLEAGAAEKEEPWDSYRNRCGALPRTPASGPDLHVVRCCCCCCCCCLRSALRRISYVSPAPVPCSPPSTHPQLHAAAVQGLPAHRGDRAQPAHGVGVGAGPASHRAAAVSPPRRWRRDVLRWHCPHPAGRPALLPNPFLWRAPGTEHLRLRACPRPPMCVLQGREPLRGPLRREPDRDRL